MTRPIPAFPSAAPRESWGDSDAGMTLRDWFAGQAIGGLCSANLRPGATNKVLLASLAYSVADAMLAERNKER